jgi:hypothetical protein
MDQETVLRGVDVGAATALDHEVKRGGCDDPQRLVERRETPAALGRLRLDGPDLLLERGALTIGPQGAAEDLRRIVGHRLSPTCERALSPGDQRGTDGDAAFQEPAAARVLSGGFEIRRWIAHRHLLGRQGLVSYQSMSPFPREPDTTLYRHAWVVKGLLTPSFRA